MKTEIHRRLKNLAATIARRHHRSYTLQDLCWECWRQDKRDFSCRMVTAATCACSSICSNVKTAAVQQFGAPSRNRKVRWCREIGGAHEVGQSSFGLRRA